MKLSCGECHTTSFSMLLDFCEGNPPVTGGFPSQRPVMQSFDMRLNKWLSKQSKCWWFAMPWCSNWRHCNVISKHWFSIVWGNVDQHVSLYGVTRPQWVEESVSIYHQSQCSKTWDSKCQMVRAFLMNPKIGGSSLSQVDTLSVIKNFSQGHQFVCRKSMLLPAHS